MEQITQSIIENLWWAMPGRLAGVRMPTADELIELLNVGVGAIVSVFHESYNLQLYRQTKVPYLWLPIAIDSSPSPEQLQTFQNFVTQQNQLARAVAVHCSTGRHRTGTMLAAYLIKTGWSYPEAMQQILQASSQTQLPESQMAFLQTLSCPI